MSELNEDAAIADVVDRLAARFPALALAHIESVVNEQRERLAGGRIRAFIPVLVERESLDRLRKEARPVPLRSVDEQAGADARTLGGSEELDPMEIERRTERTGTLIGDLGGGPD